MEAILPTSILIKTRLTFCGLQWFPFALSTKSASSCKASSGSCALANSKLLAEYKISHVHPLLRVLITKCSSIFFRSQRMPSPFTIVPDALPMCPVSKHAITCGLHLLSLYNIVSSNLLIGSTRSPMLSLCFKEAFPSLQATMQGHLHVQSSRFVSSPRPTHHSAKTLLNPHLRQSNAPKRRRICAQDSEKEESTGMHDHFASFGPFCADMAHNKCC